MDITLERILSLFPQTENGKPVHGSSKELSDYLGLPHNTVTLWKAGKMKSYKRYLHEIAAKYGVSVEWLKGETDEKAPQDQPTLNTDYLKLNAANRAAIDAAIAALLETQEAEA